MESARQDGQIALLLFSAPDFLDRMSLGSPGAEVGKNLFRIGLVGHYNVRLIKVHDAKRTKFKHGGKKRKHGEKKGSVDLVGRLSGVRVGLDLNRIRIKNYRKTILEKSASDGYV